MMSKVKRKPQRVAAGKRAPQQRRPCGDAKNVQRQEPEAQLVADMAPTINRTVARTKLMIGGLWLAFVIWAYWPVILELIATWRREPDYSHGFMVLPFALLFLFLRRATYPGLDTSSPWLGLAFLGCSLALRFAAARYYMSFLDGWSLLPLVAAAIAILGGRPLLRWSLPSVGFLIFMVPLPFRLEAELSAPLQRIATKLSSVTLQLLGQPAFPEGNVILLGDERLEVAQACSGLRLFMSTLALTYVYLAMIKRAWWERLALALGAIPIAILSNSMRIVATGIVYQITGDVAVRNLAHDSAGWCMIALAAGLFAMLLWYLGKLTREETVMDVSALVRQVRIN